MYVEIYTQNFKYLKTVVMLYHEKLKIVPDIKHFSNTSKNVKVIKVTNLLNVF